MAAVWPAVEYIDTPQLLVIIWHFYLPLIALCGLGDVRRLGGLSRLVVGPGIPCALESGAGDCGDVASFEHNDSCWIRNVVHRIPFHGIVGYFRVTVAEP